MILNERGGYNIERLKVAFRVEHASKSAYLSLQLQNLQLHPLVLLNELYFKWSHEVHNLNSLYFSEPTTTPFSPAKWAQF